MDDSQQGERATMQTRAVPYHVSVMSSKTSDQRIQRALYANRHL